MRQVHTITQGSPEWHAFRATHHGASEASAMMGLSPYMTRSELLRQKKTGITKDVDEATQAVFDRGHQVEIGGRAMAEEMLGEPLYPVVMSDGQLSASCDGLTADDSTAFEHKQWNNDLAESIRQGVLPEHHWPQVQQVMMVTGADRVMFMCSDGTPDRCATMMVLRDHDWAERIIAGWAQFDRDLEDYVPQEVIPAAVAAPISELPALDIQIAGSVVASNLVAWKSVVVSRIDAINTALETDQDFADAAEMVKFLDDGEKRIDLVKSQAQAQASSIDEAFRAMDEIKATMRTKRLELDKLVTARKEAIKTEQVMRGKSALADYVAALNTRLGKPYMPTIAGDFATAIKGKRTIASLVDAVDSLLASKKIEADTIAARIEANLMTLREMAKDHAFLFSDTHQLVLKDTDAVEAIVKQRIAEHKAAEEKRQEELRQRIAAEERIKLEKEQAAKSEVLAQAAAPALPAAPEVAAPVAPVSALTTEPQQDAGTIKLGDINAMLAPISITQAGLESLGFHPIGNDKRAILYRACDFRAICEAIATLANRAANSAALKKAA